MDEVERLIELLRNPDIYVRWKAATQLEEMKDARATPSLIKALKDENHYVRCSAASALGKIKDSSAVPALIEALKDKNGSVIVHASDALGEIKNTRAIQALIEMLKDKRAYLRSTFAYTLSKIKDDAQVIPVFIEAMEDWDQNVRMTAAQVLAESKDARVVPALTKALKNENECVRKDVAKVLEKIGIDYIQNIDDKVYCLLILRKNNEIIQIGNSAVPALIEALKDGDPDVRSSSAWLLGESKDIRAVPALIGALKGGSEVAADALGKIRSASAVPALIEALENWALDRWHKWTGYNVVNALDNIGDAHFVPLLIEALTNKDEHVRENAAEMLRQIGYKRKTTGQLDDFEKEIDESYANLKKRYEKKGELCEVGFEITKIKMKIADRKNELASKHDLLFDDVPKPPKKGGVYQELRRVRNG